MTDPKGRPPFDDVYRRARAALADGVYRPGDRVGVKDLATRLSTSATPAREILSRLVGLGLVEEHRREGYYLRPLDERQVSALYRLHALCVDGALRVGDAYCLAPAADDADPWAMFDALVAATGEVVPGDVCRLLHARIAVLRRCESLLFDDFFNKGMKIILVYLLALNHYFNSRAQGPAWLETSHRSSGLMGCPNSCFQHRTCVLRWLQE